MRLLIATNLLKKNKTESGFNLIEMLVVTAIVGIMAAISAPNLLGSQRDNQAKEVFSKIRGALIEAQTNANRKSSSCTVTITTSSISGTPAGCVLEPTTFDSSVVSVTSTGGLSIAYDFQGDTGNAQTIQVAPKDGSGNPILEKSRCIVISSNLGMIRTGFYKDMPSPQPDCENTENLRYDNQP